MARGNRTLIEETLRLLMPLDLLLTMASDFSMSPLDRQLAADLLTALYISSAELPPTPTTLVAQLAVSGGRHHCMLTSSTPELLALATGSSDDVI